MAIARTRKGAFARVAEYGNKQGSIGEFSRSYTEGGKQVGKTLASSAIGGKLVDSKGNRVGHNYTVDKDGNKLNNTTGSLTKRQKYYDRRTGLGMVGG